MGDKCGRQVQEASVGDRCGRQVGDKCKLIRPKAPKWHASVGDAWETCRRQVEDQYRLIRPRTPSGRQVWETSGRQVLSYTAQSAQRRRQVWETSVGDRCGRQVWETSVGDKSGRQKWETTVGDKCKLMQPKPPRAPRVGD